MESVYIVTYERYDHFQILEVFRSRESALKYLESDTVFDMIIWNGYVRESFHIIEKIVWDD